MEEKKSSQQHGAPHGGAKPAEAAKPHGGAPAQGAPKPQGAPQRAAPSAPKKDYGANFRGIVRLAGKDLKGEMPLRRAITRVRGVGERLGTILGDVAITEMKLPDDIVVGLITEEQMAKLEDMLIHPMKYGVPSFMLNRRKDPTTGEDLQLIGNDVRFYVGQDIEGDKGMNTWRGYRHAYGQKVRGQHTRSTGRTGMTVGVLRKTIMAAKAGAAAEAGKPGAPGAPAAGGEGKGAAPKVGAAALPKAGAGAAPKAGAPAAGAKPEAKKEAPKK